MRDGGAGTTNFSCDPRIRADVVVVGAGIAGLSFALRLPESLSVALVTKGPLGESNTRYAQGGIAAAIGPDDTAGIHLEDTIAAGGGLTDVDAARAMAERGASAVRWLLKQGTQFDLQGPVLSLGQEAAHSRRRILHAGGDATGAEIQRALIAQFRSRPGATILEHTTAIDIAKTEAGNAGGVMVSEHDGVHRLIEAPVTVLANGGAGQLWAVTSNPEGATADGVGMALRAGVALADLEFAQFHPTVLNVPGVKPFLISEAVRGEGAWLVNGDGERFMIDVDARAELAPRNVVASAIQHQLTAPDNDGVFLSLRHLEAAFITERFPTIAKTLAAAGLDLATDLIPVAPAMHYFMGGIVAGVDGQTSLAGLIAIGEASCTGVHGANRLASNSLLEGLVFGINAADRIAHDGLPSSGKISCRNNPPANTTATGELAGNRSRLQEIMSRDVGVVRTAEGLTHAIAEIETLEVPNHDSREAIELRNMIQVSRHIALSALAREESRGGHVRADFPERDRAMDGLHQVVEPGGNETRRSFGHLDRILTRLR